MSVMAESGCLEQVDRGADNPTSYYKNYHETRKGGQGPVWAVATLIIILQFLNMIHAIVCVCSSLLYIQDIFRTFTGS
jgi:hypothetical protein